MQAGLVIVDKDTGSNVHSIAEHNAFLDTAFFQTFFNLRRDIDEFPPVPRIKPQLFPVTSHNLFSPIC
jgi:hypothetical protein